MLRAVLNGWFAAGTASRRQPLIVAITTAGWDRESICWELHQYAQQVIDGTIEDPSFYPVIYAADKDDDWTDKRVWAWANPNLGKSCGLRYFTDKLARAKELSREEEAMPEITVTLGDKVVQTLFMDADPVKIGRTPDNDIPIDNLAISRHHATISRLRQYYIIEDHGSSNGTFVNGKEIKKVVLEDKDVITIGKHKLEFRRQKQV
ncbi:MAG: FHA domain-containing protein, partial [Proteobacteria bacterium]|nr:FHA domain-containing protein [Pseudomonadota bacterium]